MIGALLLALLLPAGAVEIAVYHTNDIHGWIMPRSTPVAYGGAPALAAVYRAEKGPKLLVDAGDWFQGTPEGTLSRGLAAAEIFNAVPYDAVAVGNHDFDLGEKALRELVRAIRAPVLAANLYRDGRRVDYLRPWIVKEVAGVRIGIFGLVTARTPRMSYAKNVEGLEFRREIDEAKAAVAELRKRGCTVIVAVTHLGLEDPAGPFFEGQKILASEVEGIDLVVGGHTHVRLDPAVADAAHGTLIAQAGWRLEVVGRVVLVVDDETKRVRSAEGRLVALSTAAAAPDVQAVVDRWTKTVAAAMDRPIASSPGGLYHERYEVKESPLGDWLTDCARERAAADVYFQNAGGIRAALPAGPVTLRSLFNIMPFDNAIVVTGLRGREIREILEQGVSQGRGLIQLSGLEVSYNRSRPRGRRVLSVTAAGQPLVDEKVYAAAAPDFMVEGGDDYGAFARAEWRRETGVLVRDALAECARRQKVVRAPEGGRIKERE